MTNEEFVDAIQHLKSEYDFNHFVLVLGSNEVDDGGSEILHAVGYEQNPSHEVLMLLVKEFIHDEDLDLTDKMYMIDYSLHVASYDDIMNRYS